MRMQGKACAGPSRSSTINMTVCLTEIYVNGYWREMLAFTRSLTVAAALQGKDAAPHNGVPLDAIIIEFKVQDTEETELTATVRSALKQIEERDYQAFLIARGIPEERIRKYGFAFCGKRVLIAQQDPACLQ